jgi:integrase
MESLNLSNPFATVREAAEKYLADLEHDRNFRPRSFDCAAIIIHQFVRAHGDVPVSQVDWPLLDGHLKRLAAERKHSPRTQANHFIRLKAFLTRAGVSIPSRCCPDFVEPPVRTYETAELNRFFSACSNVRELAFFKLLLGTGLRREEAIWLHWTDLDLDKGILTIQPHPPHFLPKTGECRRVPIPNSVRTLLRQLDRRTALVFPSQLGNTWGNVFRSCKRIARRAGLDPAKFSLHQFRRTYATTLLRSNADLKTVQALMGHRDLKSTLRYLNAITAEKMQSRVSEIFT